MLITDLSDTPRICFDCGDKILRYLRKREMMAFYILQSKRELNLEEALTILHEKLCIPRHVSRKILKHLRNTGYIEIENTGTELKVRIKSLTEVFDKMVAEYANSRCRRA